VRLQLGVRASVRRSEEHGTVMLMFSFFLGPLEVFCLSHLPKEGEETTLTYVKVALRQRAVTEFGGAAAGKEQWLAEHADGAATPEKHAKLAGVLPGTRAKIEFAFGPLHFAVTEDGRVCAKLVPRRVSEVGTRFVEHWAPR
jgi:hypothetical protein